MTPLSTPARFVYGLIGRFYQVAHRAKSETALGPTWAGVIHGLTLLLVVMSLIRGWGVVGLALTIALDLTIRLAFWIAKRRDYIQFVAQETADSPAASPPPLPPNEKISLIATGRFSTDEVEAVALHRPATYWQLPLGEHAFMVEIENGRFLYQFLSPSNFVRLQTGWLIHGSQPQPALALTFETEWGPEFADTTRAYYIRSRKKTDDTTRLHTLYLHFQNPQDQHRFQNSLTD